MRGQAIKLYQASSAPFIYGILTVFLLKKGHHRTHAAVTATVMTDHLMLRRILGAASLVSLEDGMGAKRQLAVLHSGP
jgi:hypothetical protein